MTDHLGPFDREPPEPEPNVLERVKELRGRIVGTKQIWGHEEMLEALADAIAEIERVTNNYRVLLGAMKDAVKLSSELALELEQYTEAEPVGWEYHNGEGWQECVSRGHGVQMKELGYETRVLYALSKETT